MWRVDWRGMPEEWTKLVYVKNMCGDFSEVMCGEWI